jgi:hypothetical protein
MFVLTDSIADKNALLFMVKILATITGALKFL